MRCRRPLNRYAVSGWLSFIVMCRTTSELTYATRNWAEGVSEVRAVILFGSRAKGTSRTDSDWDVCIVVDGDPRNTWYGTWGAKKKQWKKQFCKAVGLPASQVQFCSPTSEYVKAGLEECSRILFLRDFDLVQTIKPKRNS